MDKFEFLVKDEHQGERLDRFLAQALVQVSRSAVQQMLEQQLVRVNGVFVSKNYKLRTGDCIQGEQLEPEPLDAIPQDIPVDIVYEDEHLLVVNKPKGMVVHPAPGNPDGTLVNALLYHCSGRLSSIGGVVRPGIVHRIDKDTSGLLVVAKDDVTHNGLSEQMSVHSIHRLYHTVVYGCVKQSEGYVEGFIGRHPNNRKKMAVVQNGGKYAYTAYRLLENGKGFSYLECKLKTGRTHQIRVHMASVGHPVAGDPVYGPKNVIKKLQGQCLHAKTLGFIHPISQQYMEFDSALPDYFTDFLKSIRKEQV